jgi:hypothetical protein
VVLPERFECGIDSTIRSGSGLVSSWFLVTSVNSSWGLLAAISADASILLHSAQRRGPGSISEARIRFNAGIACVEKGEI